MSHTLLHLSNSSPGGAVFIFSDNSQVSLGSNQTVTLVKQNISADIMLYNWNTDGSSVNEQSISVNDGNDIMLYDVSGDVWQFTISSTTEPAGYHLPDWAASPTMQSFYYGIVFGAIIALTARMLRVFRATGES